jgi:hypothetical protein
VVPPSLDAEEEEAVLPLLYVPLVVVEDWCRVVLVCRRGGGATGDSFRGGGGVAEKAVLSLLDVPLVEEESFRTDVSVAEEFVLSLLDVPSVEEELVAELEKDTDREERVRLACPRS